MSVIHVRHIRSALERSFSGLIDLSDVTNQPPAQQESVFLTRSLAAFCLAHVLDLDQKTAAQSIVDGFDDNGIDAIHYHQADRVLYVVQSKWIAKGTGSPPRGEVQKFIQGFRDLLDFRLDRFNSKVQAKTEDLRLALDDAQVRFVLLLGYTGQDDLGQHAKRDLDDLLSELTSIRK